MPTPVLWNSAILIDDFYAWYGDFVSYLSVPTVHALATGRFVYNAVLHESYSYGDADVRDADGSMVKFFPEKFGRTVAALNDGFVFVWDHNPFNSDRADIRYQIYDQFGNAVGAERQANTIDAGDQTVDTVTALANGSFVISWLLRGNIRAQIFDSTGAKIGAEFTVNTSTAGVQNSQSIVALDGGGFVAAWQDASHAVGDTDGTAIRLQRFSDTGAKVGGEILVNTTVVGDQERPFVVALNNGGFAVFWQHNDALFRGQFFGPNGAKVGGEKILSTPSIDAFPSVTVLDGGNVVVALDGSAKATIFSQSGAQIGGEINIAANGGNSKVLGLSDGNFLAFWTETGIWGQLFNATGARIGNEFLIGQGEGISSAVELADGRVVVAWQNLVLDPIDTGDPDLPPYQFGRNYSNIEIIIDPRQGAVNLAGTAYTDDLIGTSRNDRIAGLAGNDQLDGGPGKDALDGGVGHDAADYSHKSGAVVVTLNGAANVQVTVGGAVEDTIRNFEGVFGGAGNDRITGDANSNDLRGGDGNDVLRGLAGGDSLIGGTGIDTMSGGSGDDRYLVDNAGDKVVEAVGGGNDSVLATVSYTLAAESEVETMRAHPATDSSSIDLTGNGFANTIVGNAGRNRLAGVAGSDTLDGRAGDDVLVGGAGKDILVGGTGRDTADYRDKSVAVSVTLNGAAIGVVKVRGVDEDTVRTVENVLGGRGNDTITGDGVSNDLRGGAGDDSLNGAGGVDVLGGGLGKDTLDGGDGQDSADYGEKTAAVEVTLKGAANAQVKVGGVVEDTIRNIEKVLGGSAADRLAGDNAANDFRGGAGNDILGGGAGDDSLAGEAGLDTLNGGTGHDSLIGGAGADTMNGGAGDDRYFVHDAGDKVIEAVGGGNDRVVTTVSYSLQAGSEVEMLSALGGGFPTPIELTGNAFGNTLVGDDGDYTLIGLAGNDTLIGKDSNVVFVGGPGQDTMTRDDNGTARFIFNSVAEIGIGTTRDVIIGFKPGPVWGHIDLSTIDANEAAAGDTFTFLAAKGAALTGVAGQLRWFQENLTGTANDRTIVEGDTNGDSVADFQLELTGLKVLSASDFVL